MKKFDLMSGIPNLDRQTLNYVWVSLWRRNICPGGKNAEQRIRISEREHIMDYLQELADRECEG